MPGSSVRLTIRVHPRASRNEVRVRPEGSVEVWITAAPVDRRANEALCRLLASHLAVAPTSVAIVGGARARTKQVEIEDMSADEAYQRLRRGR